MYTAEEHGTALNSNLILLILEWCSIGRIDQYFKFQSDSINTVKLSSTKIKRLKTLNSNLILLIRLVASSCSIADPSLNSNLILLIQSFVNQATGRCSALNSNLILLIPVLKHCQTCGSPALNSNLILLIRQQCMGRISVRYL